MAPYDWRMSCKVMQQRDFYFTKLKALIEVLVQSNQGRRVVIVAHSFGSSVFFYFMSWVQSEKGGNGGKSWVNDHIHSFVNIAGPLLGVPKAFSSLLSAEMRDTAEMSAPMHFLKERLVSQTRLVKLFRSWGSLSGILIVLAFLIYFYFVVPVKKCSLKVDGEFGEIEHMHLTILSPSMATLPLGRF